MSTNTFAAWLAFTLYFGAAWADAELRQRTALRRSFARYGPGIRDRDPDVWKVSFRVFMEEIQQIMGAEWEPKGEWAQQIDLLLKGE